MLLFAGLCDFACITTAFCEFESNTFPLRGFLHIPSARRTNVIWNLEQNSAAARPLLSHPTCSLAQVEVSGSGRGESQYADTTVHRGRHTGSPAGPAAVLLAHSPATKGQGRSHNGPLKLLWGSCTHSNTQTDTDAKLWNTNQSTVRESTSKKRGKSWMPTHSHTLSFYKVERWRGFKSHIDRSHKHPPPLHISNIPGGVIIDHLTLKFSCTTYTQTNTQQIQHMIIKCTEHFFF